MKRKNIKIFFIFIFLFSFPIILNAESLDECIVNSEYLKWEQLPIEQKEKTIAPPYCDPNKNFSPLKTNKILNEIDEIFTNGIDSIPPKYSVIETLNPLVKNQMNTGGCWAFATTTLLENASMLKYGKTDIYSPRHIEYSNVKKFKNGQENEYGYSRNPGNGGEYRMSANYLANKRGPVLEKNMPFKNNEDQLIDIEEIMQPVELNVTDTILKTSKYGECDSGGIKKIKEYIMKYGGVGTTLYMDPYNTQYYNRSTGAYFINKQEYSNHAVTIVGWDDDYSKSNFSLSNMPKENGAWIIQNSYGKGFGKNGYNYVSYETFNICTNIFAIKNIKKEFQDNAYIYDKLGTNASYGNRSGTYEGYTMNIFKKDQTKNESIKEITFATNDTGDYEIYLYTGNASRKNISNMEKIGEGKITHAGYLTHVFKEPIYLSNDLKEFSVAIKYMADSNKYPLPVSLKIEGSRHSELKPIPGVSFISYYGNNWEDLSQKQNPGFASIKVFTKTENPKATLGKPIINTTDSNHEITIPLDLKGNCQDKVNVKIFNENDKSIYIEKIYLTPQEIKITLDKNKYIGKFYIQLLINNNLNDEVGIYLSNEIMSQEYKIDPIKKIIYIKPETTKNTLENNTSNVKTSIICNKEFLGTGDMIDNYHIVVKGDVTSDGIVDISDIVKIANSCLDNSISDTYELVASDVTNDNSIDISDVVKISNFALDGKGTLGW